MSRVPGLIRRNAVNQDRNNDDAADGLTGRPFTGDLRREADVQFSAFGYDYGSGDDA
jgi:hypothetical protein